MRWMWFPFLLCAVRVEAGDMALMAPLAPAQSVEVYAGITARVQVVAVAEGDRVAAGDTLVLLNDAVLRLVETVAAAAYRKGQAQLDRTERMHARGLISVEALESVRYETETARLQWSRARLDLSRAVVRSPMAGLIAVCQVREGDFTAPRKVLFQVIVPGDLVAEVFVPADCLTGVREGQGVTAQAGIAPDAVLLGRVMRVSPVIDPKSGTCRAVILFPGAGKVVRPGTLVRVIFEDGERLQTKERRQQDDVR